MKTKEEIFSEDKVYSILREHIEKNSDEIDAIEYIFIGLTEDKKSKILSQVDENKDNLLSYALKKEKRNIAEWLLENGSGTDNKNKNLDTPLLLATQLNDTSLINKILSKKPQTINLKNNKDESPLLFAATAGNIDAIKNLIDAGAYPDTSYMDGTILAHAVDNQDIKVVKTLLGRGANPNDIYEGKSLIDIARESGSEDIEKELSDYGAKSKSIDEITASTTLKSKSTTFNMREKKNESLVEKTIKTITTEAKLLLKQAKTIFGYLSDKVSSYQIPKADKLKERTKHNQAKKATDKNHRGAKGNLYSPSKSPNKAIKTPMAKQYKIMF